MEKAKTNSSNSTIISFLILEILAFLGFSLGNSFLLFALLGFVTFALILILMFDQIKKEGLSKFGIFLIPLIIFGVLTIVSPFSQTNDFITSILVPVSFVAFAGIGYCASQFKEFKLSTAFLVIYGSLALLTLISYFYTMIQFTPFYTITHKNMYTYFDGFRSSVPVGDMSYFLMGFSFYEVSLEYFSLFPSLLSTSIIALFFLNPKKDKKMFWIYVVFALIGVIPLLTMPTKFTILTDFILLIIITIILLSGRFKIKLNWLKYVVYVLLGIVSICFVILVLNSQSDIPALSGLQSLIASNPLLNKLFNTNGLIVRYKEILSGLFSIRHQPTLIIDKLLGFNPYLISEHGLGGGDLSNSFLFDSFAFSGLFGVIALIVFAVFAIKTLLLYFKNSKEDMLYKSLLLGFVFAFFGYSILNFDSTPYIYYSNIFPFYISGPFFICVFLITLTFKDAYFKVEEVEEIEKDNKETVIIENIEEELEEIAL